MDSKNFNTIQVSDFGSEDAMQLVEKPVDKLSADQIRVQIMAVGVNPVDTYIRSGNYARLPTLPYTPGGDGAGIVHEVGADVKKVKKGDRVYLAGAHSGSYSQFCVTSEDGVQPLPERVSYEQGAGVNVPYGTAYRAIFIRGQAKPGDKILVHGASGSVGLAAVQICVAHGITVYGTASSEEGRKAILDQGAAGVYNHRQEGYMAQVKTDTGGVDLVIEMLANVNLEADMGILAKNGRIMVVGNRGSIQMNPRGLMACEGDVRGVAFAMTSPEERKVINAAVQAGLSNGSYQPIVGVTMPLGSAPQAHRDIMTTTRLGNLVLLPFPATE